MNQKVTMVVRILLGVFMLIFGVNKLFPFMPPFEMVGDAKALMGIYVDSGFYDHNWNIRSAWWVSSPHWKVCSFGFNYSCGNFI